MNVQTAAFVAGILFGSVAVLSASFVWLRHQVFGIGGSMLSVVGIALLGLSIWSGITVELSSEGLRAEFRQLEQQLESVAGVTEEVTQEVRKMAESNEVSRQQVIQLTNALEARRVITPREIEAIRRPATEAPAVDVQRLDRATESLRQLR